jgi:hypothetical protein
MASVLRVLLWKGKNNNPLLIDISKEMGLTPKVTLNELRNVDGKN